jgi:hypothetical protein
MESLKNFINDLDELVKRFIKGYKLYGPNYQNPVLECEIKKNEYSCKIPSYFGIKDEDIISTLSRICNYIGTDSYSCNVRISNYPEAPESMQRELKFILDEMNRVKIVKFSEPYINETKGLKVQRGMIQVSFYISY